jgi:hypothetical protein
MQKEELKAYTFGRYKIGTYMKSIDWVQIESVSEDQSVGPFAQLRQYEQPAIVSHI